LIVEMRGLLKKKVGWFGRRDEGVVGEIWAKSRGLLYVEGYPMERGKFWSFVLMRSARAETIDLAVRSCKDDRPIKNRSEAVLLP
jgi:hypothetical protein